MDETRPKDWMGTLFFTLPFLKFPSYVGESPVLPSCVFPPCESSLLLIPNTTSDPSDHQTCGGVFLSHQAILCNRIGCPTVNSALTRSSQR